jgi:hypothetical protein
MADPNSPDYFGRATDELKGMASDGFAHPSTKPVLTGAAIGAVAAIFLPVLTIPVGLVGGAGYALWRRIKR